MRNHEKRLQRIFPRNLRTARIRRGLSQGELSEILGLNEYAISHYERGACLPSLANLCKLADALNVPAGYLIGDIVPLSAVR